MFKNSLWIVVVASLLFATGLQAAFEYESVLNADIDEPILDVTTNRSEDLVFVLTQGNVVIFSMETQSVLDRIPVENRFDRIAYQADDRLVLTAKNPSRLHIIRFSRVHDIDLNGRAIKGPPDAKVTLVVFDDYQ